MSIDTTGVIFQYLFRNILNSFFVVVVFGSMDTSVMIFQYLFHNILKCILFRVQGHFRGDIPEIKQIFDSLSIV